MTPNGSTSSSSYQADRARKIVAIRGRFKPDTVSQRQLQGLVRLMRARWIADRNCQKAALAIESRLNNGATIEPGLLEFDRKMKWVPL